MDIHCRNTSAGCYIIIASQLSTDQVLITYNNSLPDTYYVNKGDNFFYKMHKINSLK